MNKLHWTAYDRSHFAARHLLECADTAQIRNHNSYWPAGTTLADIEEILRTIIARHGDKIKLPAAQHCGNGFALYEFMLANGINLQLGITSAGRITLAQPLSGPNVIIINDEEARRLFAVLHADSQ
jgi:hypothetical protein